MCLNLFINNFIFEFVFSFIFFKYFLCKVMSYQLIKTILLIILIFLKIIIFFYDAIIIIFIVSENFIIIVIFLIIIGSIFDSIMVVFFSTSYHFLIFWKIVKIHIFEEIDNLRIIKLLQLLTLKVILFNIWPSRATEHQIMKLLILILVILSYKRGIILFLLKL